MSNKETLQEYNERLDTNNITLDSILETINNLPEAGSSGDSTNLFIQEAEPSVKSGIWLKTNSTDIKNIKNINVIGEDINIDLGDWNAQSKYQQLPYNFYLGSTAIVGTDIYIFFNATSSSTNALYKYDTTTNTYTKLNDVPFDSNRSTTSVIGTDIYIFGSTVSPNTQAYKYDTLKNTFTELANTPYNTANASSVVYNNAIYIFGGSGGNKNVYRYDISTNSYTKLNDMIYTFSVGETAIVGDTVYMFGVGTEFLYMQKYNITTNTHTDLGQSSKNIPKCLAVPIGDYIFVLGSSYGDASSQTCYKFNTLDNTMIELSNIPYKFGQGRGGLVGNKIYLIGSKWTENMKRVQSVNVTIPEYNKDLVLLSSTNDNKYNTKLSNSIECDFEKCYIYSKNKSILPSKIASIYYGNNSSWVKTIQPEYVQDGLVALFDGDYAPDSNGRWLNKKGTDYIYEVNGKNLLHDANKYKNNKSLTMMTSADYYKQGYTIEIVGKINSITNGDGNTGGWFLTMNETGSWGIAVTEDTGKITFVNHADVTEGKTFTGYYQKTFGASLYLEKTYDRGATAVKNTGQGSVNGCEWFSIKENTASGVGTTLTNHSILCYYARTSGTTFSVDGEINCIRIYNRKLTNTELAYNHMLDKEKYDLTE